MLRISGLRVIFAVYMGLFRYANGELLRHLNALYLAMTSELWKSPKCLNALEEPKCDYAVFRSWTLRKP